MIKLAIDLGSSVTKIFSIGSGIVLAEPSCVAVASGTNTVKAIGEEAKQLIGKTAEYTTIVSPVFEADIVNEDMAAVMLSYFLSKIEIGPSRARKAEVVLQCPAARRKNCSTSITALRTPANSAAYGLRKCRFCPRSGRI